MRLFVYLFVLISAFSALNCKDVKKLIVAEEAPKRKIGDKLSYVLAYKFIDGRLVSKDTLLSAPNHLSNAILYKNRYIVSDKGCVIDLTTKSVILNIDATFDKFSGDTLYYNPLDNFIFNLATKKLEIDKNAIAHKYNEQVMADKKYIVKILSEKAFEYRLLIADTKANDTILISDKFKGTLLSVYSSFLPEPSFKSINDSFLIYADYIYNDSTKHSSQANQYSKININLINIKNRSIETIGIIDSAKPAVSPARFEMQKENELIFNCSKGEFIIDFNNKKIGAKTFDKLGFGFEMHEANKEKLKIIKHNGIEIGEFQAIAYGAKSIDSFVALYYLKTPSSKRNGIKAWNGITKKWTEIPTIGDIIGWILD